VVGVSVKKIMQERKGKGCCMNVQKASNEDEVGDRLMAEKATG